MDIRADLRERHLDHVMRSLVITGLVFAVVFGLVLAIGYRREWDIMWAVWVPILLGTPVALSVWALTRLRYEVIVDDEGIQRTGPLGDGLAWSQVADVIDLRTKQGHLAVVSTTLPRPSRLGEGRLFSQGFKLPDGTMVIQATPAARRAIEANHGPISHSEAGWGRR